MTGTVGKVTAAALGQWPAGPGLPVIQIDQVVIRPRAPQGEQLEVLQFGPLNGLLTEPFPADFTLVTIGRVLYRGAGVDGLRVAADVDPAHLTGETAWILPAATGGYFAQETRVNLRTDLPLPRHLDYRILAGTTRNVLAAQPVRIELATLEGFLERVDAAETARPAEVSHRLFLTSVRKLLHEPDLRADADVMVWSRRDIAPYAQAGRAEQLAALTVVQNGFERVDLSRVLCGIDAAARQGPNPQIATPRADLALTWSGDLGRALAEYVIARHAPAVPAEQRTWPLDRFLTRHAPPPRLLGGIDGVNIGAVYAADRTIAANLRDYYDIGVHKRCTSFVAATLDAAGAPALPLTPGRRFTQAAVSFAAGEIAAFARHHLRLRLRGRHAEVATAASAVLDPGSAEVTQVTRHLLDRLEDGLDAELSPPSNTSLLVLRPDGVPFAGLELRLISPDGAHPGRPITTDIHGTVTGPDAGTRRWRVGCATHELTADLTSPLPLGQPAIGDHIRHHWLPPGQTLELYARTTLHLECLQCGRAIRVTDPPPAPLTCPNDGHDLSALHAAVRADPGAFTAPTSGQNPEAKPTPRLTSRGTRTVGTLHGPVTAYWEETRFLDPAGGDYRLWAATPRGPLAVDVIGRATWGAAKPRIEPPGRRWEFHQAHSTDGAPYLNLPIPLSENRDLSSVYHWMTIHHSADPAGAGAQAVRAIQGAQVDERKSDIAYHFVIDAVGGIFEGRPLGIEGEHAELFNAGNLGIVLLGDFGPRLENGYVRFDHPTALQLEALDRLVDVLAARFGIRSVWGHQARKKQVASTVPTECPGMFMAGPVAALRAAYPGPPL